MFSFTKNGNLGKVGCVRREGDTNLVLQEHTAYYKETCSFLLKLGLFEFQFE